MWPRPLGEEDPVARTCGGTCFAHSLPHARFMPPMPELSHLAGAVPPVRTAAGAAARAAVPLPPLWPPLLATAAAGPTVASIPAAKPGDALTPHFIPCA